MVLLFSGSLRASYCSTVIPTQGKATSQHLGLGSRAELQALIIQVIKLTVYADTPGPAGGRAHVRVSPCVRV